MHLVIRLRRLSQEIRAAAASAHLRRQPFLLPPFLSQPPPASPSISAKIIPIVFVDDAQVTEAIMQNSAPPTHRDSRGPSADQQILHYVELYAPVAASPYRARHSSVISPFLPLSPLPLEISRSATSPTRCWPQITNWPSAQLVINTATSTTTHIYFSAERTLRRTTADADDTAAFWCRINGISLSCTIGGAGALLSMSNFAGIACVCRPRLRGGPSPSPSSRNDGRPSTSNNRWVVTRGTPSRDDDDARLHQSRTESAAGRRTLSPETPKSGDDDDVIMT